jgi:hypothetical protein
LGGGSPWDHISLSVARKRDTRLILLRPALLGCCVTYGRYLCAGVIYRRMTAHKLGGGVPISWAVERPTSRRLPPQLMGAVLLRY